MPMNQKIGGILHVREAGSVSRVEPDDARLLPQRIEGIKRAMTAGEVAGFLAVSPITVYKMAKAGRLPSFRIGTAVRFDPRAVAEWLQGKPTHR
jgi:excisionase family DNA binding protein